MSGRRLALVWIVAPLIGVAIWVGLVLAISPELV